LSASRHVRASRAAWQGDARPVDAMTYGEFVATCISLQLVVVIVLLAAKLP
jgi:hypothetical protein